MITFSGKDVFKAALGELARPFDAAQLVDIVQGVTEVITEAFCCTNKQSKNRIVHNYDEKSGIKMSFK